MAVKGTQVEMGGLDFVEGVFLEIEGTVAGVS
jgi:hypothetical protein